MTNIEIYMYFVYFLLYNRLNKSKGEIYNEQRLNNNKQKQSAKTP